VYGFLDPSHVFVLVHVVLNIGLSCSCLPRVQTFGGEVTRAIAVVALSDPLLGATLGGPFHLGDISPKVLLVCPVQGKASSGEIHWDWDVVHGSQGVRGVESWRCLVIESLWGSAIESLEGSEDQGVCACPHCSEELSGFDHCNGFIL
jgi:hypothetical protein